MFPELRLMPAAHVHGGRRGGLHTAFRALLGLICPGKKRDQAFEIGTAPGGRVSKLGQAVRRGDGPKEEGPSNG